MRFSIILPLLIGMAAGAAYAQTCPNGPNHSTRLELLHEVLRTAPDPIAARRISNDLWAIWLQAPDEVAQELLDHGMERMRLGDHLGAQTAFDRLVDYCPDFAEAYNQRAFSNFLQQRFDIALLDLDRALELNPRHLGALTGRALTLIELGQNEAAQTDLKAAVALNPWLNERSLIIQPPGEDI
ncbi:tetratricopeptide repeat protein [Aestuariibius sp. HNIBRBA575]|uniref:tetratricopeptide repeat protein n=1 Tax=Aestuariibius sp. HNIBRBA575 TaxID=3233343 RepID=UPI0034A5D065